MSGERVEAAPLWGQPRAVIDPWHKRSKNAGVCHMDASAVDISSAKEGLEDPSLEGRGREKSRSRLLGESDPECWYPRTSKDDRARTGLKKNGS